MTWTSVIIFCCVWLMIAVILGLKYYLDKRRERIWNDAQPYIDKGLEELFRSLKKDK